MALEDDAPTAEELAALENVQPTPGLEIEDNTGLPGGPPPAEPPPAAEPPAPTPPAAPTPPDPNAPPAPPEDPDAAYQEFVAKHKERSAEELLRLAFDKEQARKVARYEGSKAKETVATIQQRMADALANTQARQRAEREAFEARVKEDPDAALREQFDRQQQKERQDVEAREWDAYVGQQAQLAASIIPAFDQNSVAMMGFGVERMGYDEAQLRAVHDARDLTALYMAMQFDKLVQAGVVTFDGQFRGLPEAVPPASSQPARTPPTTLSAAGGGRAGGQPKSLKQQADEIANMSDADFEKLDPAVLESVLKGLGSGGQ